MTERKKERQRDKQLRTEIRISMAIKPPPGFKSLISLPGSSALTHFKALEPLCEYFIIASYLEVGYKCVNMEYNNSYV